MAGSAARLRAGCRQYARAESGDALRALHRVVEVRQDAANEFALARAWVPSLRCPGHQCAALLLRPLLERVAAPDVLARVLRFAELRRAALHDEQAAADDDDPAERTVLATDSARYGNGKLRVDKQSGLKQCPRCSAFAVGPAPRKRLRCRACLLPLCPQCEYPHPPSFICFAEEISTTSFQDLEISFIRHVIDHGEKGYYRICPNQKCAAIILRYAGCDHMVCSRCQTRYNWSQSAVPTGANVRFWFKPALLKGKMRSKRFTKRVTNGLVRAIRI